MKEHFVKTILKNIFFIFLFISQMLFGCRQTQSSESQESKTYKAPEPTVTTETKTSVQKKKKATGDVPHNQSVIPSKVYEVLKYVRENGSAPVGYVGGRKFGNYENLLPKKDSNGRRINYQEWDVNPKRQGKNRGAERLITGSDGKAYFTNNHYKSFVEI